ncbi:hypothetical protein HanPI659440_Chr04g0145061 [Helianthus annuus]|nr:hypothetical protein HanPI659440_Chr04g0145061 [Helianthus annuus]
MISTEKWSRFEMERMNNRSENRIILAREERSFAGEERNLAGKTGICRSCNRIRSSGS